MEIRERLELHERWIRGGEGGVQLDARGENLWEVDLSGADLRGADFQGADLQEAALEGADLRGADLREADLRGVDFRGADLRGAKLSDENRQLAIEEGAKI